MAKNFPAGDHLVVTTPLGNWFRNPAVRETVESVLVAVLLALIFRFFEAEAYIIPTGSMAPDLQGRHVDVVCPECDFPIRAGEALKQSAIVRVACPLCQHHFGLRRGQRDNRPFSGDRILVNKFAYDFGDPERWDVIVFKYPNNGKQNYIKRLIGLPNEGVLIEKGDIYSYDKRTQTFAERTIARKPARKLLAMLQTVDDTDHLSKTLLQAGWPSRWQQWDKVNGDTGWTVSSSYDQFKLAPAAQTSWLRYRHLVPRKEDWDNSLGLGSPELPKYMRGEVPAGKLITDHYAYNDVERRDPNRRSTGFRLSGIHWVGDLSIEAEMQIESGAGSIVLELVEGGARFRCLIDVETGEARFTATDDPRGGKVVLDSDSSFETPVKGKGNYRIQFANADDQLYLWINGKDIQVVPYSREGDVYPWWTEQDPGDAEPAGIGGTDVAMTITRLHLMRDIYYTSANASKNANVHPSLEYLNFGLISQVQAIQAMIGNPASWTSDGARKLFDSRKRDESWVFHLEENQFFPMGDNSPESEDARNWPGARFVDRSYLLGEALFIYWPHAKTSPLPFWPNFERMSFIR